MRGLVVLEDSRGPETLPAMVRRNYGRRRLKSRGGSLFEECWEERGGGGQGIAVLDKGTFYSLNRVDGKGVR